MAYQSPPPPPASASGGARPGIVTAAAVLFFIGGALPILFGLFLLVASSVSAFFLVVAAVVLALGALQIYVGTQVLGLHERGRSMGIVLTAITAFFNVVLLFRRPVSGIIGLAFDVFIINALTSAQEAFTA